MPTTAAAIHKTLFEQIHVNATTGEVTYPQIPGFELDKEKVYRVAKLFAPHCQTTEQAVQQAIHGQLTAFTGALAYAHDVARLG